MLQTFAASERDPGCRLSCRIISPATASFQRNPRYVLLLLQDLATYQWSLSGKPLGHFQMLHMFCKMLANVTKCLQHLKVPLVKDAKYLGVTISEDLTWANHIPSTMNKANSTLGFLWRNPKHCPGDLNSTSYVSQVRSLLEYAATLWDPWHVGEIKAREMIQRRAACFMMGDNRPIRVGTFAT